MGILAGVFSAASTIGAGMILDKKGTSTVVIATVTVGYIVINMCAALAALL